MVHLFVRKALAFSNRVWHIYRVGAGQSRPRNSQTQEVRMADVVVKPKKVTIARRDWIDKDGNPLNSGDEAKVAGIRYTPVPSAQRAKPGFDPDSELAPADS